MSEFNPNTLIATLAAELATELGEGWTLDTAKSMPHFCYLDGPDNVRLGLRDVANAYMHPGQALGKVTVHGIYPDKTSQVVYEVTSHEISVTGTRPVAAIAGDIARRLVPQVAADMVTILARLDQFETNRHARHAVRDELAAILPDARVGGESDTATSSHISSFPRGGDTYSDWQISHDGTRVSELKIRNLPIEKAKRIAAIITE
jgi:hypothetical protein